MIEIYFPAFNHNFNTLKVVDWVGRRFNLRTHSLQLSPHSCLVHGLKTHKFKYSKNFIEDWCYYDQPITPKFYFLILSKTSHQLVLPSKNGFTAKECFWLFDSKGLIVACREPLRLARAYTAKFTHGITMDNWLSSCKDGISLRKEVKNYCNDLPKWVYKQFLGRYHDQQTTL